MKKLVIAACATTLFSATALAGPPHQAGHQRHHAAAKHSQSGSNHNLQRDIFNLALIVGAAFAIDAALDSASDTRHASRHDRHANRHYEPAGRHHSYNQHGRRQHDNHAHPGSRGQSINERQQRQRQRIRQGIKNGSLAHGEAKRLRQQQARIRELEHDFRADGRFTKHERAIIQARLDKAHQRIYRLKHNDRYAH